LLSILLDFIEQLGPADRLLSDQYPRHLSLMPSVMQLRAIIWARGK